MAMRGKGERSKAATAMGGARMTTTIIVTMSMLMMTDALGMEGHHSDVPPPPLRSMAPAPQHSISNVLPPGMPRKTAEPPRVMKTPNNGAIARSMGCTDIPIDGMIIFGSSGLLLGLIFQKCGKSAVAALTAFAVWIKALEMNRYISFNTPKMQEDAMDSKTYKYVEVTKNSFLSKLPASIKEQVNKFVGIALMALQNNLRGISVAFSSFAFGWTIGNRL
ncbi:hypothetical protein GUITHDRAFT_151338 [Guillardia theta CCMP2712]|uniref:Uncharacterized protein n=1 Tax=Guillardia theta (strain CCMP2712) TaxID=905079 RepID=L1JP23_GUITC|nr:hypothetical protein GUITHDRAFT_151338 [Guillardia theta CCMP2712]EKX49945.1 hypothetical protein GUITHDRAFT_151338 [Guillardia theta CCMP2712]|eukprot:XP_005836925.1 hypothetical protein GUITHDRAFT_151338 [Guillardia theta CCMP2712]